MKNNEVNNTTSPRLTTDTHGPQGVDKAPGEETSANPDQFLQETQKGKNKVDGDPSKESDQPIDQP